MNTLAISNVSKTFGRETILNNVAIECKTNEIIGIFGRNGSGKSTLLKLIFGTLNADYIQISINSKSYTQKSIIPSQKIGYLPQDTFLPKEMKVRDTISLFFPKSDNQDKVFYKPYVATFDRLKVGNLSLGQLRYLELLIIGNLNHDFLLLDEPFSMIEPLYKEAIKTFLIGLKKQKGIILTDHYYDDVLNVTDKNYILKGAEMIAINTKSDLVKHEYLKRE
jgi:ABC-type multidrug transport system ATPase subunit